MLEVHKHWFIHTLLCAGAASVFIFYASQNHQNISEDYQITHKMSEGLTAYAKFTGKQFLIINHDPFDWMDVTVAINTKKGNNQGVVESVDSAEILFTVPRIKTGESFTLQANSFTTPASPETQALPTQVYSLKILGKTPRGQSSWDGRWE